MCGIAGMVGKGDVSHELYDALTLLQHRGQDAAGMVTCDGDQLNLRKRMVWYGMYSDKTIWTVSKATWE